MHCSRVINAVDSHTAGEPTRVVTGGLSRIPGESMAEKKSYLEQEMDSLRTLLLQEPRGHRNMFGAVLTEPATPGADIGVIFMDAGGYLNMCGHGSIGAVTVALETGILPLTGALTGLTLDTPGGLVRANVSAENGRVTAVSIINVPSFLFERDLELDVPGLGAIAVDIAFGGNFFALAPAADLGLKVSAESAAALVDAGMRIRERVNECVRVAHPERPHINSVDLVEIYERRSRLHGANAVVFGDRSLDRSPCGTGTCAKLAALHARGEIRAGEDYIHEGVLGTVMRGRVLEETAVSGIPAVVPEITARAYITGFLQAVVDPEDPLKDGFLLGSG